MRETADLPAASDSMDVDTTGIDAQLAVVLSYDGAPFAGFARQPNRHTVQGNLEQAFSLALRRPVEVVCAGRTDAGVHARGQVVSFPITHEEATERNLFKLKRSFQALTDDAIAIQSLALMPPDFSARFSAIEREYRYLIVPGGRHPLFLRDWCWDVRRELNVDAMNEAAALLVGEHDFKSFCLAASAEGKNTVRTLHDVHVVPVNVLGEDALSVRVAGNAFLHSMVRSIVGTLVMVGAGLRAPAWVTEVLEARNRQAAGENAPARGLVFWRVLYRDGVPCYERDVLEPISEPDAREAGGDAMLKQSCLGETPTGHFEPCGTARGTSAALLSCSNEADTISERCPEQSREAAKPKDRLQVDSGITEQDVKVAEAALEALERGEEEGDVVVGPSGTASDAFSEAALNAPLPEAVEEAANRPGPAGMMRRNEVSGPAIPAAPRTHKVTPADPRPAEGEVSISFEVHRDSAATRTVKAQKARKQKKKGRRFLGLFSKMDDGDA